MPPKGKADDWNTNIPVFVLPRNTYNFKHHSNEPYWSNPEQLFTNAITKSSHISVLYSLIFVLVDKNIIKLKHKMYRYQTHCFSNSFALRVSFKFIFQCFIAPTLSSQYIR